MIFSFIKFYFHVFDLPMKQKESSFHNYQFCVFIAIPGRKNCQDLIPLHLLYFDNGDQLWHNHYNPSKWEASELFQIQAGGGAVYV